MNIEIVKVGHLETNCYILSKDDKVLVIDPGDEYPKISEVVGDRHVVGTIITHYHDDHTGALSEMEKERNAKTYNYYNLKEGKNKVGNFEFECIRTPGHKEDAISLYFPEEKALFAGDFIFYGSIGRWDLEGGSISDMKKSIQKILEYPLDVAVYPGHGPSTSLRAEKTNLEKYTKYF